MGILKNLYKTVFVFPHRCYIEYSWSYSEKQAYLLNAKRVAKKQGVMAKEVLGYFKQHKDKTQTTVEAEMEANDEGQGSN